MGLEILAIALGEQGGRPDLTGFYCVQILTGVSSFTRQLEGRNIVIWSDNTGAESVIRRGTAVFRLRVLCIPVALPPSVAGCAKHFDHCCLVHCLWKRFIELRAGVWLERVPIAVNVADDPSRRVERQHSINTLSKLLFVAGKITGC